MWHSSVNAQVYSLDPWNKRNGILRKKVGSNRKSSVFSIRRDWILLSGTHDLTSSDLNTYTPRDLDIGNPGVVRIQVALRNQVSSIYLAILHM